MTRINCIDPSLLQDKHLVAEYRELPRVFALIRGAQDRGEEPDDARNPRRYRLGKGHVRFFYDKAQYLLDRQKALISECKARGFKVQFTEPDMLIEGIELSRCKRWKPSARDKLLNKARINNRGGLRKLTTRR